jgi:Fe-S cluster assembly iron-binding protein IscA
LAIGFALGALYLVCYELPHAIVARLPQAVVLTALFAAAYVGIPLVMVRSRSLNAFFKHQEQQRHGETFVAPGTENRRNVVTLTPAAAELARKIVSERGFPPGTALRIVRHKDGDRRIDVQYDVPADDDRDWIGESLSIVVLIDKTIASELEGLTIDAANGQYVFLFQ